jgi:hypothetical protein
MPRTIDEGFRDFHTKLTATASETEATKRHRASVEACLKNNFGMTSFFRSGSFGNGTNVSGYSDVDYFAVIPSKSLKQSSNYSLQVIKNVLDTRFPFTGVCVRCPSVRIPFGEYASQDTEIVPADYVKAENGFRIFDIADCENGWMKASPEAHNAYVAYVNKEQNYKVKPLIRFMKAWKYFRNVPISSFYLELRTSKYAASEKAIVYSIDIKNLLKFLLEQKLPAIQDPMGISGYIYPCKSDTQKEDALSKLQTAYIRADKAWSAEVSNDIKTAFDWWKLLFGESFPKYYY